jgi:hypothetical protein
MKESMKILKSFTVYDNFGERIYYIDVKEDKKGNRYCSITESKKRGSEKHKVFVFRETLPELIDALNKALFVE